MTKIKEKTTNRNEQHNLWGYINVELQIIKKEPIRKMETREYWTKKHKTEKKKIHK